MASSPEERLSSHTPPSPPRVPANLREGLQKGSRALRLLRQCNRALLEATEEGALLHAVCRLAVEVGGYRLAWVGQTEPGQGYALHPTAWFGLEEAAVRLIADSGAAADPGRSPWQSALCAGQPVVVQHLSPAPADQTWQAVAQQQGFASILALPVGREGRQVGVLVLCSSQADTFDEDERELLEELTNDLAFGITSLHMRQEAIRVAEALRESEDRYKRAVAGSNAGIWDWDLTTGQAYLSPRFKELLGFQDEELPSSADRFFSRIHPDELAHVHQAVQAHLERRVPYDVEVRLRCKDGEYRWFNSRGQATWSLQGRPLQMAGSITDIHERRQFEQALQESEVRHRQLVEQAPDIIFINRGDRIHYINPTGVRLLRAARVEDLLGRPIADLFHPRTHALIQQRIARLRSAPGRTVPPVEETMVALDGTLLDVEVHASSFLAEGALDIEVVCRDLTERKRTQRELKNNEERLRLALSSANQGIYDLNLQTGEVVVSPEYVTLLGYEPEQFRMSLEVWTARLHPEDRERCLATLREYLKGTMPEYRVEFRLRTRHQTWKWLLSAGSIVERDEAGTPIRMLGIHTDITSLKEKESQLAFQAQRAQLLLELPRLADLLTEQEFLQATLDRLEELTGSRISFLHYVNEDQNTISLISWSHSTLAQFCTATFDAHYPITQAGIWADSFRQRRAVVINDYATFPHKRGLPEGHPKLLRLITLPVLELGKVRMITGVGNKETEYTPIDVETVQLVSEEVWRIVRRRSDEAALHASETRYRQLFEANPHPMWVHDVETQRFLAVNQAAVEHYRYSEAEFLTRAMSDVQPPDEQPPRLAALSGEEAQVWHHLKKDGTRIDVELSTQPMEFAGRQAQVVLVHDVTRRRQVEAGLRQQVQMAEFTAASNAAIAQHGALDTALDQCCRAMVQHLDAALARVWVLNRTNQILELQASAGLSTNLSGAYSRIALGMNKISWIASERRPFLSNDLLNEAWLREPEWARQTGIVAFAGYPLLVEEQVVGVMAVFCRTPLSDTARVALSSVANAIAVGIERKRIEEETRRVNFALESSADGIVITDQQGVIHWVNPSMSRLSGYSRKELLGQSHRLFRSGKHDETFYKNLWSTISEGSVWRGEIQNRRKNGEIHFEELTITPIRDVSGQVRQFVAIHQDISRQKLLEAQFHQSQKLEAVGRLCGGVAHDFNNLLTVINGYSELLLTMLPPRDPRRESLRAIHDAGERASSLTRQLLAFSRQAILEPKILDLNKVAQETQKMLGRLIGEDITLTLNLDPGVHLIKVDPGQLTQVLLNLAVNARDAMPRGGSLEIATHNSDLDDAYCQLHPGARPGPYVELTFRDTGTGMPPNVLNRIFEPFFTTKAAGKGTGLGLSVVHGVILQSGGHITVESEVGRGTTFQLYFPMHQRGPSLPAPEARPAPATRGQETLLLVEDEDGVRAMALASLAMHGYTVLSASDPRQAQELFQGHGKPIDLLVTDLIMPGMSGRDLADLLRQQCPTLKVLYMSGYTDDALIQHGLEQGEVAFLQKPFSPTSLASKVREVLDAPS
ncbi:MAG: PAS domain S-box protein [Gemmataceae bacterium]